MEQWLLDEQWIAQLAYLADIFTLLADLNRSLQGPSLTIFSLRTKIDGFRAKIALRIGRLEQNVIGMFPSLEMHLQETGMDEEAVLSLARQHLLSLVDRFPRAKIPGKAMFGLQIPPPRTSVPVH